MPPFALNADISRQGQLSNTQKLKMDAAYKFDSSIEYACNWIKAHAMEFEAKVYFPPMITVNVPNPKYAWQVEMCTSMAQRKVREGLLRI